MIDRFQIDPATGECVGFGERSGSHRKGRQERQREIVAILLEEAADTSTEYRLQRLAHTHAFAQRVVERIEGGG